MICPSTKIKLDPEFCARRIKLAEGFRNLKEENPCFNFNKEPGVCVEYLKFYAYSLGF